MTSTLLRPSPTDARAHRRRGVRDGASRSLRSRERRLSVEGLAVGLVALLVGTASPLHARPSSTSSTAAGNAASAAPLATTYAGLGPKLSRRRTTRRSQLRRFAQDPRAALADRVSAAAAWAALEKRPARRESRSARLARRHRRVDALLLEASLLRRGETLARERRVLRDAARELRRARKDARGKRQRKTVRTRAAGVDALVDASQTLDTLRDLRSARKLRSRRLRRAVDDASATYRRARDPLARAELRLHQARLQLVGKRRGRAQARRTLADVASMRGRDAHPLRVRAREALLRDARRRGAIAEAARVSLDLDHDAATDLDRAAFSAPAPNPWARSRTTAQLCARWERRSPDACATYELERYGTRTFFDHSRAKPTRFAPEKAEQVLAEYDSLLRACVEDGARSGELTRTTLQLEWTLGHDGTVAGHRVWPRRLDGGDTDACLGEAFARFRYPRYRGETRHMALRFDIGG